MKTVILDKKRHNRKDFDCGNAQLNDFLKMIARQQDKKDNARTFVLENPQDNRCIIGFYTLTLTSIDIDKLPDTLSKKHKTTTSGALIARLAVDKKHKDKGFGAWLLIDALQKLLQSSDIVGFPFIIVDAKDEAKNFYLKYGFRAFVHEKDKLFITVDSVRKHLGKR